MKASVPDPMSVTFRNYVGGVIQKAIKDQQFHPIDVANELDEKGGQNFCQIPSSSMSSTLLIYI